MTRANARRGAEARAAGRAFEKKVEARLEALRERHDPAVACWEHNEPRMAGWGKRPFVIGAAVADYTGVLVGGLAFALEAKSVKDGRFERNAISATQQTHLTRVARAGGVALLYLEFRDEEAGRYPSYTVPWDIAPWQVLRSAQTLEAHLVEEWRDDSLFALEEAWQATSAVLAAATGAGMAQQLDRMRGALRSARRAS